MGEAFGGFASFEKRCGFGLFDLLVSGGGFLECCSILVGTLSVLPPHPQPLSREAGERGAGVGVAGVEEAGVGCWLGCAALRRNAQECPFYGGGGG